MLDGVVMFKATSTVTHRPRKELTFLARLLPKSSAPQLIRWPNPEASIGQYRSTFNGQKFWEIIDPGRKQLEPLLPAVKSLLDAHNEDLKERETVPILFALFMVGRTEVIACPTLVIICSKKGPRQKVADLIRNSEVLHKYPGVLLGTSSKRPRIPASGPPQSIASGIESGVQSSNQSDKPIYVKKSEFHAACGDPIYIPVDEDSKIQESRIFRKATIGGYLKLKARDGMITIVGITVAHAFEPPHQDTNVPKSAEESDSEDSVFEFDGPSPEDLSNQSSSLIERTKSCMLSQREPCCRE
jgi:hypothetical protein